MIFAIILSVLFCTINRSKVISVEKIKDLDALVEKSNVMVKFFAPWCGHCKALAPEYIKAEEYLAKENFEVKVVEVDCTKTGKELCEKYGVSGYPMMKYFKKNGEEPIDYEDQRNSESIVKFIKSMIKNPIETVHTHEHLEKVSKDEQISILLYTAAEIPDQFAKTAEDHRTKYSFIHIKNKSLIDDHKMEDGKIVMRRKFDEPVVHYDKSKFSSIIEWIRHHEIPIFGEMHSENFKQYYEKEKPLLWVAVDKTKKEVMKKLEELKPAFAEHRQKFLSLYVDGVKFKQAVESMGFNKDLPSIMLIHGEEKFKMENEFSIENVKSFIKKYNENKLSKFFKSAPVPEKNKGPLYEVVGTTFDKFVLNEEKDVLLMFYLTHCKYCQKFEPVYKKFAELYKDRKFLAVGRLNGAENDIPKMESVEVSGYPTVYLFPAGAKTAPVKYEGKRTFEDLEEWMKSNSPLLKKHLSEKHDDRKKSEKTEL